MIQGESGIHGLLGAMMRDLQIFQGLTRKGQKQPVCPIKVFMCVQQCPVKINELFIKYLSIKVKVMINDY